MGVLGQLIVRVGADLTELNSGFAEGGRRTTEFGKQVSGVGKSLTANLTAPIRESSQALGEHSRSVGEGIRWMGELRRVFTTAAGEVLGFSHIVTHTGSLLGELAIGAGPLVAILAGITAIGYGWEKLTAGAKESAKATEEAIKSLEQLKDKQALGSLSGTSARAAELAGTELFGVQEKLGTLRSRYATQSAAGGGQETKRQIEELEQREAELRSLIQAHENEVTQIRKDKADKRVADQKEALDKEITAWKDALDKKIAMMKLEGDVFDRVMQQREDRIRRSKEITEFGAEYGANFSISAPLSLKALQEQAGLRAQGGIGPLTAANLGGLPGLKPVEITATYTSIGNELTKNQQALREGLKEVADSIGVTLAGKLAAAIGIGGGAGAGLGSSVGGQLGGKLGLGAIGSRTGKLGQAAFPVIGGLVGSLAGGLFGSLFDHKKSVDANTAALNRLNESITNGPTGFKADAYRYRATDTGAGVIDLSGANITIQANDPSEFMRQLAQKSKVFSARGGLVPV